MFFCLILTPLFLQDTLGKVHANSDQHFLFNIAILVAQSPFPCTQEIGFKIFITCFQFEKLNSIRTAAFSSLLTSRQTILEHWEGGARPQALHGRWEAMGMNQSMRNTDLGRAKRFFSKRTVKQWNRLLLEVFQVPEKALSTLVSSHSCSSWSRSLAKRSLEVPSNFNGAVNWRIRIHTFGKGNFGVREQQPAAHTGVSKEQLCKKPLSLPSPLMEMNVTFMQLI